MFNGKAKGITTELLCEAYLTSLGYNVSVPIGEDCKYDFILDVNNLLLRVQIKSCIEVETGIIIKAYSITTSGKENVKHKYSKNEIDMLGTYYNDQCYLLPIEFCNGSTRTLAFSRRKVNASIPLCVDDFTAENIIDYAINNKDYNNLENHMTVYQYDFNGNLLNTFESYSDAARFIGKQPGHISDCARGLCKTAFGYKWSLKPIETAQ